jgi:hypothetical protein
MKPGRILSNECAASRPAPWRRLDASRQAVGRSARSIPLADPDWIRRTERGRRKLARLCTPPSKETRCDRRARAPCRGPSRAARPAELPDADDVIHARFEMTNKAGPTIAKRSATLSRRARWAHDAAAPLRHRRMSRDLRVERARLCAAASRNGAWNGRLGAQRASVLGLMLFAETPA